MLRAMCRACLRAPARTSICGAERSSSLRLQLKLERRERRTGSKAAENWTVKGRLEASLPFVLAVALHSNKRELSGPPGHLTPLFIPSYAPTPKRSQPLNHEKGPMLGGR